MKAVIMAGGEGERMRPLTCDTPKPLLRLCGKPNLEYILNLLYENECSEAVLTVRYLSASVADYINSLPKEKYDGMTIRIIEETEPLGTAGSVRRAAENFKEPFLVISGDAMCDFDIKAFEESHKNSNNEASILITSVSDPREYGIISLTKYGKVQEFIEKPGWSKVISDLINTGIYYLNPSVLDYVPKDVFYDFSKDVFPKMLNDNKIIGGIQADGFWCDIGDFISYRQCQYDMMLKKVRTSLCTSLSYVSSNDGKIPGGRYKIIPPVFIGNDVTIGNESVIGPGTVIDDGCIIGNNVHIKGSVVLRHCKIENNARLTGAIVASGSTIKNSAEMFEGSVLGSNSVLGNNTQVLQNILIWPSKLVPPQVRVYENIVVSPPSREIFDDGGVHGSADAELVPEVCAKLGKACASLKSGIKIGISTDGTRTAKVLKLAMQAGAMASGAYIWDFGEAFMSQMSFFTSFCGLDMGVYIKTEGDPHGNNASLVFYDSDGLSLPRKKEKNIEKCLSKSDFSRSEINKGRDISSITSIRMIYSQELCRAAKGNLSGMAVSVECSNAEIARLLRECLDKVECTYSDELSISINPDGTELSMRETGYSETTYAILLSICCNNEFKEGKDVALPSTAPMVIDDIAKMYSKRVLRFSDASTSSSDENARNLAVCQKWLTDSLFMAMKVLTIMRDRSMKLHDLVAEIPKFFVSDIEVPINFSPVKLKDIFRDDVDKSAFASEGVALSGKNAKALVRPSKKGNKLRIMIEAESMEVAREYGFDLTEKIRKEIMPPKSVKTQENSTF